MRVLVIESGSSLAEGLRSLLEAEGFDVDPAQTNREVDLQIRHYVYDVVILEDQKPECNEWIQRWRQEGFLFPILVVTSSGRVQDRVHFLNIGADDCVQASCSPPEMVARIKALKRRGGTPKRLRIADLEMDSGKRRVVRAGRIIHLTPREFALLELLAQHDGQVVSRTQIRKTLFPNLQNYSNVVEVFISTLRNKIDKGFSQPLILTRRGEGYYLANVANQGLDPPAPGASPPSPCGEGVG